MGNLSSNYHDRVVACHFCVFKIVGYLGRLLTMADKEKLVINEKHAGFSLPYYRWMLDTRSLHVYDESLLVRVMNWRRIINVSIVASLTFLSILVIINFVRSPVSRFLSINTWSSYLW
jgi:hypothetical protein